MCVVIVIDVYRETCVIIVIIVIDVLQGDLSESSGPGPQQTAGQSSSQQEPPLPQALQGLAEIQNDVPPDEDSLLTFEEDLEFDPLKRSDSVHRSNSLGHKTAASASSSSSYATQPALLDHQMQPLPAAIVPITTEDPSSSSGAAVMNPATSVPSTSQFGDLAGISLDFSAKKPVQKRQESLGELYQMAQASSGANVMPTSVGMAYPQGMVPMVSAAPPGVQVPLGLQGGVVYGAGMVPVGYAPQGPQGLVYHQVSLDE